MWLVFLLLSIAAMIFTANRLNEDTLYVYPEVKKFKTLTWFGKILYAPIFYTVYFILIILINLFIFFGIGAIFISLIVVWYLMFYMLLIKSIFIKDVDWSNLPTYEYKKD